MDINELLKKRGNDAKINEDEAIRFEEYMKRNDFTFFDKKLANKHKEDYYFSEKAFFDDILNTTKKLFDRTPEIIFAPKQYSQFTMTAECINGSNIVSAEDLIEIFLAEFSCIAFFMASNTGKQCSDMRPYKRALIAIIDIFACRCRYVRIDEIVLDVMTKNEHITKFACFMSRAMYTFLLCHEIAHIVKKHGNVVDGNSIKNEFEADSVGYEIFNSLIKNADEHKHLEFFPGLQRAPLALFEIFDLVDYFRKEILDDEAQDINHPPSYLRKAALLEGFDFGDDKESFDLYLVVSERVSSLKYYIYKNRDMMRKVIQEIHENIDP